ncbi:MAG TPA: fumarylacetoacetate hydrolase family protein [Bacteroidales bacterium]|nr:fumarylacetoacetate hydrolase family protein [Bacteroidales bacterium]
MKILAVGMNYRKHVLELNNTVPVEPVLFIKPDSSLAMAPASKGRANKPFFLPDFSNEIHYETELVVRICKLGKNIAARFAHRYYEEVTVGLDLTARDIQQRLRKAGMPWEICKGFDGSAQLGEFVNLKDLGDIQNLDIKLDINGKTVQNGCTADMIFTVDTVIEYASRFFTLKTGDLIFTGTPSGVGPLHKEDHLEASLQGKKLLDLRIK